MDKNIKTSMIKFTILTEPIPENISQLFKKYIYKIKLFLATGQLKKYTGHFAVTRSLIEGLKKTKSDFNYNPNNIRTVRDTVIVLSRIPALKQAIELKKQGKIKKLLAGPNLVISSKDENNILSSPKIDMIIVPSKWIKIAYEEDAPKLKGKIKIWSAGIDENYWKPHNKKRKKNIIIYQKNTSDKLLDETIKIVKKHNFNLTIIKYGQYKKQQFKEALGNASLEIVLSQSESQGISLQEAWSMDVPCFCYQPNKLIIKNRSYSIFSSCPYISKETGYKWNNINELEILLANFKKNKLHFSPRKYVLKELTDEKSARLFLKILNE